MNFSRSTSFGAVLSPAGIHLVEYRRGIHDVRIVRYVQVDAVPGDAAATARTLGALMESVGARGRGVAIALSGFGSCHQLLSLPAGPPEVLRLVIGREMRRFYPDIFTSEAEEPILEYVEIAASAPAIGSVGVDLLVAAAPAELMRTVTAALAEHGVPITGCTIAPRALQRLHEVFGDGEQSEAVVLMIPGAPLLGLFHQGSPRLFSEPAGAHASHADTALSVGELVDRAALFLRQQYRGATLDQVLLAGEPGTAASVADSLRVKRGLAAHPFGDQEPGALLALGAALDADLPDRLSLLPASARPLSQGDRLTRALAVASVLVLVTASAWWSWEANVTERQTLRDVRTLQGRLASEQAATVEIREAVGERRSHAQRAALLETLARNHNRLPEVLWPFEAAAPQVSLVRVQVQPGESGWQVNVTATANGRSSAEATDAVDALVGQLEAQLAGEKVSLSQMSYAPPAPLTPTVLAGGAPAAESIESAVALTFEFSFSIPDQRKSPG